MYICTYVHTYMSSWIIKDTTTVGMEEWCVCAVYVVCVCHCMWLNPEHTKHSNCSSTTKFEFESRNNSKNVRNRSNSFRWPWQGRVPYHFFSSPAPSNVQCPCENLFTYSLTFSDSKYKFHHVLFMSNKLMSLNIDDMKTIRSVSFSGSIFRFRKSCWISSRICNDENPGKIFHSTSIASPTISRNSLKKRTFWILPLDLSHLSFAPLLPFSFARHRTESE